MAERFTTSRGGVRIADSFRSNLIVDRYDPMFIGMRASKLKHLCSENSEDAVTWNVFRSLRQIDPGVWLPKLQNEANLPCRALSSDGVAVTVWRDVSPPPALLLEGDEGISEIDIVIEAPTWVWFIEAKFRSDISDGTTTRPDRDQILRNLDVGSYYAGVRKFYFTLLVKDAETSRKGITAIEKYRDLAAVRSILSSHRPDGLDNLQSIGVLEWHQLGRVLASAATTAPNEDECEIARRALAWLREKGLAESAG